MAFLPDPELILASASPRRRKILAAAGIPCSVLPSGVAEDRRPGESAEDFVRRIAGEKAAHVLAGLSVERARTVLGADTIVLVDGMALGKPDSPEDAARMLRLLSGRTHRVLTGICLLHAPPGAPASSNGILRDARTATTKVEFASLTDAEIAEYVAGGEPFDKAGAYAIQGRGSKFVRSLEGDYFNVVGLPVALVYEMLKELGRRR